jgi:uncharacterized membrane protein (DUF2068 family)
VQKQADLNEEATPTGITLLAIFFTFGTCMCALTIVLLIFPGTMLDSIWRLNPKAHAAFQTIGWLSILLMAIVGTACALAAIGLARNTTWGYWLGIVVLAVDLAGDLTNVFLRHDLRTLIGVPIAGALMVYLYKYAGTRRRGSTSMSQELRRG